MDGDIANIPPASGIWRYGELQPPLSKNPYDIVHWDDIDDGSYTLYFKKGTTFLCQLAFEN